MKTVLTAEESAATTGQHRWGTLSWLASAELQNTAHTAMAYVVIRQGQQNPRHRHNTCEELLHLLQGQLTHSVGDETHTLTAGDTITIPAGAFHHAVNIGDEDAHMIVVYATAARDFELEADVLAKGSDHDG